MSTTSVPSTEKARSPTPEDRVSLLSPLSEDVSEATELAPVQERVPSRWPRERGRSEYDGRWEGKRGEMRDGEAEVEGEEVEEEEAMDVDAEDVEGLDEEDENEEEEEEYLNSCKYFVYF